MVLGGIRARVLNAQGLRERLAVPGKETANVKHGTAQKNGLRICATIYSDKGQLVSSEPTDSPPRNGDNNAGSNGSKNDRNDGVAPDQALSEAKYRTLFETIEDGFCVMELVRDERGRVVDLILREANPAFARHTGLQNVKGKSVNQLLPNIEDHWIASAARVCETGESARIENYLADVDRWYCVRHARVGTGGSPFVSALLEDITERKRQERQQALIRDVSTELLKSKRMSETVDSVSAKIAAFFGVNWCVFSELTDDFEYSVALHGWSDENVPPLVGRYRMLDFLSSKQLARSYAGEVTIVSDTQADARTNRDNFSELGVRSFVTVPTYRRGQWRSQVSVLSNKPRQWRDDDVDMLRGLSDQIWMRLEMARAEEALRLSNQRLSRVLEVETVGVMFWNFVTGSLLDANDTFLTLLGYTRRELEAGQLTWQRLTPPEYERVSLEELSRLKKSGRIGPYEKEYFHKDGTRQWFVFAGSAMDETTCVEFCVDISGRKKMEAELRASEERYRSLFESIDEGFCIIEMIFDELGKPTDYRVLEMNPAFVAQTGLADAKGRTVREMVPLHEERWFEVFGRIALTGQPERFQQEARHLNPPRWYDVYAFRYGRAEKRQIAVLFNDVAARKQAEEALREANLELAEADQRKNEFLAMLSHELRNPLAPIANSLYVLEHTHAGGEQAERARQVIARQVAQLSNLVNDLLDVTRISRNKVQLQKERLQLCELIQRVVEDHRTTFEQAGVEVELVLASRPVWVMADRTRIVQAIGNLLQNSAKFTKNGGRATVAVDVEGKEAVVRVADNGVGIARETLERIFQPFTQEEQPLARGQGGLGLGLALVKGLVELHGGTVSAKSFGVGHGTEFAIRLPLDTRAELEPAVAADHVVHPRRRVLIIEDNIDAADSLRAVLELRNHAVAVSYSGSDGVIKARDFRPDVVLCDIGLPGMSGYDVARTLRADASLKDTVLVAVSGYALAHDQQRALEAGFQQHLPKPLNMKKLEHILATRAVGGMG